MVDLPLRRLILYKHGVGYFERRGSYQGTELSLRFSLDAMDDVLKSLIVIDMGEGKVRSIDYDRPESWHGRRLSLPAGSSMRSLIEELRGRKVRLNLHDDTTVEGLVMGLDNPSEEEPIASSLVTLYRPDAKQICVHKLGTIRSINLLDNAADEVKWTLSSGVQIGEDRTATIQLSEDEHDLLVAYLAPAPSWRVSYRLMIEKREEEEGEEHFDLLLQGWGLIDNVLNEDLTDVRLSLVAGRPVSFRYSLYEPQQPDRPLIQDQIAPLPTPEPMHRNRKMRGISSFAAAAPMEEPYLQHDQAQVLAGLSMDSIVGATSAEGEAQGTLFRYDIREPISVQRGRSALVPLFNLRTACRQELVYRGHANEHHPMATVSFDNTSGFALERGPVTVIQQRAYGGESIISWTSEGAEVRLRYAMALEVQVREEYQTNQWTRRLRFGEDMLIHEVEHESITLYHLTNTSTEEHEILIEHPRNQTYELYVSMNGVNPDKVTSDTITWKVTVPAKGEKTVDVHERRIIERYEEIRSLTLDLLRQYLTDRMLDQTTVGELRNVLALYNRLNLIQQRYQEIEIARNKLHEQQGQIRGNLDVLQHEGKEGELRTRYITTLQASEDRLEALRQEEEALRQEEQRRKEEIDLVINKLNTEPRL